MSFCLDSLFWLCGVFGCCGWLVGYCVWCFTFGVVVHVFHRFLWATEPPARAAAGSAATGTNAGSGTVLFSPPHASSYLMTGGRDQFLLADTVEYLFVPLDVSARVCSLSRY
jgi:hypothetical protein